MCTYRNKQGCTDIQKCGKYPCSQMPLTSEIWACLMRKGNDYLKNKITAEFPHSREKRSTHSRQHKRLRKHVYAQLHLTLCDHTDCSPPGSSVHGILQARILEWVVMSSSRGSSRPRNRTRVSCLLHWQADFFLPLVPHQKIKGIFLATHSSTLAWRIPWREEAGKLQSMGSQRVRLN